MAKTKAQNTTELEPAVHATLYPYQRAAANFIKNNNRVGVFLDMGLGKTLVTLTALVELAQEGKLFGHVLIIAPKFIAQTTWVDEINKWAHTRGARFERLTGRTMKKRHEIYDSIPTAPPTIYLINRELVTDLVKHFPDDSFPFLNVIIDEAQSFKSHSSERFKALKTVIPYTHRVVLLTGTPSPNGLQDIWTLIYLLDGGQRLGENITTFRETFFYPGRLTPEGYPYEWLIIPSYDQVIYNRIQDLVISMKKEDYLTMPPVTHNVIELSMSKKEREVYNTLKRDLVLPLIDGTVIEASNAAVLHGKLQQLANGAIYEDEDKSSLIMLHEHKLNAFDTIVDGANGQSILCFYWFTHDRDRLHKRFKNKGAEIFDGSSEQLKRWNNGDIPILLAQPASAGHGLNFQHGGHIMVFFSVPTSLELYEQSIGRLHRNGQTKPVIIHYLRVKGTVETQIISRIIEKKLDQDALIEAVKANVSELITE